MDLVLRSLEAAGGLLSHERSLEEVLWAFFQLCCTEVKINNFCISPVQLPLVLRLGFYLEESLPSLLQRGMGAEASYVLHIVPG